MRTHGLLIASLVVMTFCGGGDAARVRGGSSSSTETGTLSPELYRQLGDMSVAPILTGMWQVSGSHGYTAKQKAAVAEMELYAAAGLNCFDLADHYGPAEDFVGAYVTSGAAERAPSPPFYLTKRVNFLHTPPHARPRPLPP